MVWQGGASSWWRRGGVGCARIELIAACRASVIDCWSSCMSGDMLVWIGEISGTSDAMMLTFGSRSGVCCTLGNG